jgi:FkbM family methyltransferase
LQSDLIYDIGFHTGEDADYYLKKGFRVVGIEADPLLCARGAERFSDEIRCGQLTLVNKAVARKPGTIEFYQNTVSSGWNTCDPTFAEHWTRWASAPSVKTEVEAVTMASLLETYGVPYYAKIDIEGYDAVCIDGLVDADVRPQYVSWEAERDNFKQLRHELATMAAMGYTQFKVVPQRHLPGTSAPQPSKEGRSIDFTFPSYTSGPFGDDLKGTWLTPDEALKAFRRVFMVHTLVGDEPLFPRILCSIAWRMGMRPDWYDCHAKRSVA